MPTLTRMSRRYVQRKRTRAKWCQHGATSNLLECSSAGSSGLQRCRIASRNCSSKWRLRNHFSAPASFRIARHLLFNDMKLPGWVPSFHTPCSPFSSHICDDLGDRRDVLLQEIASYLLLQNDFVKYQFEATRSIPNKFNGPSQRRSLWRSNRQYFLLFFT